MQVFHLLLNVKVLYNVHMISISTLSAADADFIASKEHSAMFVFIIAITTKPITITNNIPIAIMMTIA